MTKKRAKQVLRERIRYETRKDGNRLTGMRIAFCDYGRTGDVWRRQRWLCDVYLEINYKTYCGWGRVIRYSGRRVTTEYYTRRSWC